MIRTSEDVFMRIYGTDPVLWPSPLAVRFVRSYIFYSRQFREIIPQRVVVFVTGGGVALNSCLPIWKRHSLIGELRNGNEKQVAAFLNYSEQFRAGA